MGVKHRQVYLQYTYKTPDISILPLIVMSDNSPKPEHIFPTTGFHISLECLPYILLDCWLNQFYTIFTLSSTTSLLLKSMSVMTVLNFVMIWLYVCVSHQIQRSSVLVIVIF